MQVNADLRRSNGSVADRVIAGMRQADDGMRTALAALRDARSGGPDAPGLPVERLAGLATDMTGGDVRFLTYTGHRGPRRHARHMAVLPWGPGLLVAAAANSLPLDRFVCRTAPGWMTSWRESSTTAANPIES